MEEENYGSPQEDIGIQLASFVEEMFSIAGLDNVGDRHFGGFRCLGKRSMLMADAYGWMLRKSMVD